MQGACFEIKNNYSDWIEKKNSNSRLPNAHQSEERVRPQTTLFIFMLFGLLLFSSSVVAIDEEPFKLDEFLTLNTTYWAEYSEGTTANLPYYDFSKNGANITDSLIHRIDNTGSVYFQSGKNYSLKTTIIPVFNSSVLQSSTRAMFGLNPYAWDSSGVPEYEIRFYGNDLIYFISSTKSSTIVYDHTKAVQYDLEIFLNQNCSVDYLINRTLVNTFVEDCRWVNKDYNFVGYTTSVTSLTKVYIFADNFSVTKGVVNPDVLYIEPPKSFVFILFSGALLLGFVVFAFVSLYLLIMSFANGQLDVYQMFIYSIITIIVSIFLLNFAISQLGSL